MCAPFKVGGTPRLAARPSVSSIGLGWEYHHPACFATLFYLTNPLSRRAEPVFDLDPSQLEQTYKGLQKQLHPDKFSTASSLEQEYAHQQVRLRCFLVALLLRKCCWGHAPAAVGV